MSKPHGLLPWVIFFSVGPKLLKQAYELSPFGFTIFWCSFLKDLERKHVAFASTAWLLHPQASQEPNDPAPAAKEAEKGTPGLRHFVAKFWSTGVLRITSWSGIILERSITMCVSTLNFINFFFTDAEEFPHFVWTGWDMYCILRRLTRKRYGAHIDNNIPIVYDRADHTHQERWEEHVDIFSKCFCILSPSSNNFWFWSLRLARACQKELCYNSSAFGRK